MKSKKAAITLSIMLAGMALLTGCGNKNETGVWVNEMGPEYGQMVFDDDGTGIMYGEPVMQFTYSDGKVFFDSREFLQSKYDISGDELTLHLVSADSGEVYDMVFIEEDSYNK